MRSFKSEMTEIEARLAGNDLPGLLSQLKMAPVTRINELKSPSNDNPRKSAVLILFYPKNNQINLVLIKRSLDNSVHSGQISLPGGKVEEDDLSYTHTALREANEEIGINSELVKIIGNLSKLYIPPSNFDVYPIVSVTNSAPVFKSNHEVQKILEVSLNTLISPEVCTHKKIQHQTGNEFVVPCYYIQGEIIWGATAMIISELLDVLKIRGSVGSQKKIIPRLY